jgi:hypothetical protein
VIKWSSLGRARRGGMGGWGKSRESRPERVGRAERESQGIVRRGPRENQGGWGGLQSCLGRAKVWSIIINHPCFCMV